MSDGNHVYLTMYMNMDFADGDAMSVSLTKEYSADRLLGTEETKRLLDAMAPGGKFCGHEVKNVRLISVEEYNRLNVGREPDYTYDRTSDGKVIERRPEIATTSTYYFLYTENGVEKYVSKEIAGLTQAVTAVRDELAARPGIENVRVFSGHAELHLGKDGNHEDNR